METLKQDLPGALLQKGRYVARLAQSPADLRATQALRYRCFVARGGAREAGAGVESDSFDAACQHVMITDRDSGTLACCFRILPLANGTEIHTSYAAQFYDLSGLTAFGAPMIEVGRFCISPKANDSDVLRVAWGALGRIVDERGAKLLFGCSSFAGNDPAPARAGFALLRDRHLAPAIWRPGVKAPAFVDFSTCGPVSDRLAALRAMPSLLRSYLAMGGWVSDHAVIDPAMNTMHVFTGLEIDAVPPARAAALRALAQ